MRAACSAWWAAMALTAAGPASLPAQVGHLAGVVRDSVAGTALSEVTVELERAAQVVRRATTDVAGRFQFSDLGPGRYALTVRRIGYATKHAGPYDVAAGEHLAVVITLTAQPVPVDPVVVTASRAEQKALDAPASVAVVEREAVRARPTLTVVDHVAGLAGVDVAQTGVTQHEVVARGFSNVASGALLTLTDYRYASLPSLRINAYNFIPLTGADIERIELVRGPGAALYGPNAANGVLHVLTASPLQASGTEASVTGGERSLLQATVRHAPPNDGTLGFKVSAQYLRAHDWPHDDPIERANRTVALAQGADADTLLIGRRLPRAEKLAGELRLDWGRGGRPRVVAAVGVNEAASNVELTPLGAAQVRGWRYSYAQLRISRDRFFAQAFLNKSDAGATYLLRTGQPIVDRSELWVAQVQHARTLPRDIALTYGLDLQRTVPKTGGTITGRNEDDDRIDEVGVYAHGEARLGSGVDVVAAARVDYHNRLPDLVWSPRAALVWRMSALGNLRLTYNRAFSTPTTNNLFLDLFADSLRAPTGRALPFVVRLAGVPETGFTFRRDCGGGLCMRSPFTPASLGGPTAYVPADVTPLWGAIIDTLRAAGLDLSAIPAPQPGQVRTQLALLDGLTGARRAITDVADIPPLRPAITNTVELGYKGVLAGRVAVTLDLYTTRVENFVGPLKIETPTAFFDSTSLANYLALYLPADSARVLAGLAQRLPVGTVSPEQARDPWDLVITYRNFGSVTLWGADAEVAVHLTPLWTLRAAYSWVSAGSFPGAGGVGDVVLNAPAGKGSIALGFRDDARGLHGEARARSVAGYPVNSGVYVGRVAAFTVLDVTGGITLRASPTITLTITGNNLLDHRHQEFIGAPRIGRLLMARLATTW